MKLARFLNKKTNQIFFGCLDKKNKTISSIDFIDESDLRFFKINHNKKIDYNSSLKILAPITPSKIVAVGLNYKDHAKELKMPIPKNPILFIKPATTVIGYNDKIILPKISERVDYEAELAIIISKKTYKLKSINAAADCILGYTCANDITARDIQKLDGQWTRAKSFDTFCPLGPFIATDINPDNLKIQTLVNNQIKQDSNTNNFIFKTFEIVYFISQVMTLLQGDVIITGTPPGIGALKDKDKVSIIIENIGELKNISALEK